MMSYQIQRDKLTRADLKVLATLRDHGETWNGTLGALTDLRHDSAVFRRLKRLGLISGPNPMNLTDKGRASLKDREPRSITSAQTPRGSNAE